MSFRGAEGDEESRKGFIFKARFLATLGMTRFGNVFRSLLNQCGRSAAGQRHSDGLVLRPEPFVSTTGPECKAKGRQAWRPNGAVKTVPTRCSNKAS